MGASVSPIDMGRDYQARVFWCEACRFFEDRPNVVRVDYESKVVRYFDDVVVLYNAEMVDEWKRPLSMDCYQVKFHVDDAKCLTYQSLIDPTFIDAKTSLLQRLLKLQQAHAPNGLGCRFKFLTNWVIEANDPLGLLRSNVDGSIRLEVLFGPNASAKMKQVRAEWRDHIKVSDKELADVLRPLRLKRGCSLQELGDILNDKLRWAGLRPVPEGDVTNPYDQIPNKRLQHGQNAYTAAAIERICKDAGLWIGRNIPEPNAYRVGIRSFLRFAEDLADETDDMLSLLEYFDEENKRVVKSHELWDAAIFPAVSSFVSGVARKENRWHLHLHAHNSIAFAAGYSLDSRSGVDVAPIQSTHNGREIWRPNRSVARDTYPKWQLPALTETVLGSTGHDVAVVLNVSQPIFADVKDYVTSQVPTVGRIVTYSLPGEPNTSTVQNGTHAWHLAEALVGDLKTSRSAAERQGTLHIFASAPNAMLFFMGQLSRGIGKCKLYEYAYESNEQGAYQPSLSFPPRASSPVVQP
jgi:hypothetical protein